MSRILVTGATGFIGTALVTELIARGNEVHTLSRSQPKPPPGLEESFPWNNSGVTHFLGDITDSDSIARAMESCSQVIHLAGYAKNYAKDIETYSKINITGTNNVLDAAKLLGVQKIVATSTQLTLGPSRRAIPQDETTPRITPKFLTEYERTKTISEIQTLQKAKEGFPVVVILPTRVFGPGQLSEGNAVAELINDYMSGRLPILLNAGKNIGNYVYIDDLVAGIILALEKGKVGEKYVLGGENATLRDFFRTIDRVTGKKHWQLPIFRPGAMIFSGAQLTWAKMFNTYPRITPGWMRTFLADWSVSCEKAKNELGYSPRSLEEGIRKTCQWLLRF